METLVETGRKGEDEAVIFLKKKGYRILERNHREKWGELDIIARAPSGTVVFAEVKAMRRQGQSGLKPEDHLTADKLRRLRKLALFYANSHRDIIDSRKGWRIDSIALTIDDNCCDVTHYENIG